jgi:hypothetical protein
MPPPRTGSVACIQNGQCACIRPYSKKRFPGLHNVDCLLYFFFAFLLVTLTEENVEATDI